MNTFLKNLTKNPLLSGSFIMIVGSNAVSVLNYLYHLLMGRLLGPDKYGELAALFSLLGLLSLVAFSFGLVTVKYVSGASEKSIGNLRDQLYKKLLLLALFLSGVVILGSAFFASFLNVKDQLLVVGVGVIFLFVMTITINRSILQGTLKFSLYVVNVFTENSIKLFLGILFVYLGFSTGGAVLGLVVAVIVTWLLSEKFVEKYLDKTEKAEIKLKPFIRYSIPVILQSVAITSLYSTDLVLVKHFFIAREAGIYASLSTLGKIIFFAAGPVAAVMFPIVAKKHSLGENYLKVFLYSLFLVLLISVGIVLVYALLPGLSIKILFGPQYLEGASLLALFSAFIASMTVSYFLVNFHLSLGRVRITILPLLAAFAQILGIWFYHDNLREVTTVSLVVSSLLLLLTAFYTAWIFIREEK